MVGQFESLDFICSKPGFPALKDGDFRSISITVCGWVSEKKKGGLED